MAKKQKAKPPEPRDKASGLTARQTRFIALYAVNGNASKSALLAGYAHIQTGWELLHNPKFAAVQRAVKANDDDFMALLAGQRAASLRRTQRDRDFDPGVLKNADDSFKKWAELSPEDRSCITEWNHKEYEGGSSFRVKWVNGQLAAKTIGDWALGNVDGTKKATEAELDAQFGQLMASQSQKYFPEDEAPPASASPV